MRTRKNASQKLTVVLLSIILVLCCTIGGTLAWLTDKTETVTNTFTAGEVDITLKETKITVDEDTGTITYADEPAEGVSNAYPAIPGATYKKDPTVAVVEGSEDCYLFVKFEYSENADTYLNYQSNLTQDDGWKKVSTGNGSPEVWYRVVYKADEIRSFTLLEDLGATAGITLEIDPAQVTNQTKDEAAEQSLKWTAYAVQFNYLKDDTGAISGDSVEAATKAWAVLTASNPAVYPTRTENS